MTRRVVRATPDFFAHPEYRILVKTDYLIPMIPVLIPMIPVVGQLASNGAVDLTEIRIDLGQAQA